jgi:hypothetical protein
MGTAAALLAYTKANADNIPGLSPEELAKDVGSNTFANNVLAAFDALIAILLNYRMQDDSTIDPAEKYKTYERYRDEFAAQEKRLEVSKLVESDHAVAERVERARQDIAIVASKLSEYLADAGVAAGSTLAKRLVWSFVVMHEFFVAAQADDHWYCNIYMLELICR